MRMIELALAVAAGLHGVADLIARGLLGFGRDGVLEVEDQARRRPASWPSPARGRWSPACRARCGADGSAWAMSSVASAQTRQRPCRLPVRWRMRAWHSPSRSPAVAPEATQHTGGSNVDTRRCRDRRRRHRRQRRRLFSEHGCRVAGPPHRSDRARPGYAQGQHRALGRRRAAAVLDAREHRHVAVHAGAVPRAQGDRSAPMPTSPSASRAI